MSRPSTERAFARTALVSLTFDDALDVHLDVAAPLLEQHGLRASFYINAGSPAFAARHGEWAATAARGHELGNHTVFHPGVSSKPWVSEGIALEGYTLDRMHHELVVANRILRMVDGRDERSFAFPCSNPWLGHHGWVRRLLTSVRLERTRLMGFVDRFGLDFGSRLIDYTPLVRELFPVARCGGVAPTAMPVRPPDWHRVRAVSGDGLSLSQLLAAVDIAIARGAWLVFVFHGVGGGHHLSVDRDDFAGLLAHLARDDRVRVLPVIEAARSCHAADGAAWK